MRKSIAAGITATALGSVLTLLPGASQAASVSLDEATLATSPTYLYQLNDPTGSALAADSSSVSRRPLLVADERFTENASGDGPMTFDGTAATFGGAQYLRHGPAVRLNRHGEGADGHRSFSLEVTFTAPADMPGGTETLVRASTWTLSLSASGPAVFVAVDVERQGPAHADGDQLVRASSDVVGCSRRHRAQWRRPPGRCSRPGRRTSRPTAGSGAGGASGG